VNELASRVEGILREPAAGCFSTVDAALDAAETASGVADCVLVLGSFTTVSRALARHAAING
jgi:dihydrofolate synthase/folylpolyglutamate synthase